MRKTLLSLAAGWSLLAASGAFAQGYVGGGAGWTRIGVDCSVAGELGASCDKTSTGGKLYGGFRLADQWAVELGYFDWGKATGEGNVVVDTVTPNSLRKRALQTGVVLTGGKLEATGFGIGLAYVVPAASNWSAVARLGVVSNRGKLTATGLSGGNPVSESTSERSAQPYFGLGIGYQVTPKVAITGEADFSRVKYGVDGVIEKDSVQLLTLGLRFAF